MLDALSGNLAGSFCSINGLHVGRSHNQQVEYASLLASQQYYDDDYDYFEVRNCLPSKVLALYDSLECSLLI